MTRTAAIEALVPVVEQLVAVLMRTTNIPRSFKESLEWAESLAAALRALQTLENSESPPLSVAPIATSKGQWLYVSNATQSFAVDMGTEHAARELVKHLDRGFSERLLAAREAR